MDNFILYDDICKTENSTIYKGRRKGSINFVAIHCIEKVLRPEITNLVRLTFEMGHKNAVKFYEWYETSNHLWLVVELCTAGSLDTLLEQDGCLPETSIKQFGVDVCEGLFYSHSMGLLFCDLIPRKIMIDGYGNLKLSDFGLSKLEGEDLEQIFKETFDSTSSQWQAESASTNKPPKIYKKPFGELSYMAPEVIMGEDNTQESDIWSLGCLLYQMYTGNPPFMSENPDQLKGMIVNKDFTNPKGNKLSTKPPSAEFISLIRGLLEKDQSKRLTWKQLVSHPFWEQQLLHLIPAVNANCRKSAAERETEHDANNEENLEDMEDEDNQNEAEDQVNNLNCSRLLTDRPKTASGSMILEKHPEINVSFSISSRLPTSPQSTIQTRTAVHCQESDLANTLTAVQATTEDFFVNEKQSSRNGYRDMFFMPSELNMSPIVDNPKIHKSSLLKFEPKALPFSNQKLFKASSFLQLAKPDYERGLEQIKANCQVPQDKSVSAIKLKLHLMNYIGTLCVESSKLADSFVHIELYKDLLNIVRNGHNLEMKMKACRIMGIVFNRAKRIDVSKELTEILQGLIDTISNNRKDTKFKQALLPALGELMYFISNQESLLTTTRPDHWTIPSLAYVLIIRTITSETDLTTNHIICKLIENLASTNSVNVQKFLNNQTEVVNALWSCFQHSANNEQLRVAALRAICMLSTHSTNITITLLDRTGPDNILDCLSSNNSHIQQAILTMLAMLVNDNQLKVLPEKKLIAKLVCLFDSANVVTRAKAYLLTYTILKQQSELLPLFTQSKLTNSLERDNRKSLVNQEENDFMHKMIDMLVDLVSNTASSLFDETLSVLGSVYGRKNPSTSQVKLLKKCAPGVPIIKPLVTSQMFRARLFDADFVDKLGKLISLSKPITTGEINLNTICGQGASDEYINSITSILETLIQQRELLQTFSQSLIQFILPVLVETAEPVGEIISSAAASELKAVGMKFVCEISQMFFGSGQIVSDDIKKQLRKFIDDQFISQLEKLLVQSEPVPYFALATIQSTLNYDITLISILKVRNVLPSFFQLFQGYKSKLGSPIVIKILGILTIWSSTLDPLDLYEFNIVDYLKAMMLDILRVKSHEGAGVYAVLLELLRISDNLLRYVSEFVKKALQAKKSGAGDTSLAQQAEKLLHANKALASCSQLLVDLLDCEEAEISELACKILWVLMQLFGSECKDLLNPDNLNKIMNALMNSNSKKQKILLRISKRLVTADKQNLELFKSMGGEFIEYLKTLKNSANSEANVTISSMIDEILRLI